MGPDQDKNRNAVREFILTSHVHVLKDSPCIHDWMPTEAGYICRTCEIEIDEEIFDRLIEGE